MEPSTNDYETIGLARLADLLCNRANEIAKYCFTQEVEDLYLVCVGLNHGPAMNMLAILYDNNGFQMEIVEEYYKMAYETNEYKAALYNLGELYGYNKDYPNMIRCHRLCVEKFNDIDSAIALALYYDNLGDEENAKKYYHVAVSQQESSSEEILEKYDTIEALRIFRYAEEHGFSESPFVKNLRECNRNRRDHNAIHNKIQLFTQLNHVIECGICYETKLNIDRECGHCLCVNCYLRLYKKECPFCRM
jgi:tetratricopeptide (TPR) repeat protein